MNVAMENTQELVDGQPKHHYGDAFIRGNNGELNAYSRHCRTSQRPDNRVLLAVLYISALEDI